MNCRRTKKGPASQTPVFTILYGAFLCIVLMLSSCSNFLDDGGTREKIVKRFEYQKAPSYKILVSDADSHGVVNTPVSGEANKKVTDIFTISFSPIKDYDFLYWKIFDTKANQELQNGEYLLLSSLTDSETDCTFLKAPEQEMKLCLVPVLAERPVVENSLPEYAAAGVEKTSEIIVTFTQQMSLESIYYTKKEYDQLTSELGLSISNFLPAGGTEFEENKYYGYKIVDDDDNTDDDESIVFKNIQIINYNDSTNLLKYFNAPQFVYNPQLKKYQLQITPKASLPGGNTLFVTLEKNFNYVEQINDETKPIYMCKSVSWHYFIK